MNQIKISCAELCVESEDLMKIILFDDIDFEIKDAEELLKAIKKLTAGKKYFLLTQTNDGFTATPGVREYVAERIAAAGIIANAICIKSLPIRFIVNAYVKVNRPAIPTKTFHTEIEALAWLDEIRKSNFGTGRVIQNQSKQKR
ncbi:MAG: hypothetical protein K0R26_986 [Bacteroidota bacterium]|jgi:hypothetical protein|nr:hypothetical protein [Bacteroidota bacterium]